MKSPEELRKYNMLKVLRFISKVKKSTKSEIAKATSLTLVTVSSIINQLYEGKIVVEKEVNTHNKGRNSIVYAFNNNRNHIIGINIGIDYIAFRKENLEGEVIDSKYYKSTSAITYSKIIDNIKEYIYNQENIIGIGITIPGVSNKNTGVIDFSPNVKNLRNKHLQQDIANLTNIFTKVEKDVYAGVSLLKENECENSIALISIRGGIGCGIMYNGTIFKGNSSMAGEIGHISINPLGPKCSCGQKGCAEQYISDYALKESLGISIKEIIDKGNKGEIKSVNALKSACDSLEILLGYVNKFYDPQEIVINCKWLYEVEYIQEYFNKLIAKYNNIVTIIYDKYNYEKGAVNIIKKELLFNIENNILLGG